jgi:phage repressor protein C with HTH and peptisase S24 domain
VHVPQVRARLCAGGGSFELETALVARHPLPLAWLSRMGRPDAMVFMDVVGDSMEPGIADGDMVLVDQSVDAPQARAIMAVGFEDAIYIKRLERARSGITLLSDNPGYAPITIRGDEMDFFRVIGKIVWLCRDCR